MSYLSLYRKYRSQSFAEVAGQEHVTRTLQNALGAGRVAHAYLFSGPRGTGKTSTARLLARALNCERGPSPTPCGECTSCQEIRDGISPSVIEIDAASSRGIDEIRDLRQRVMTVPSQAGARKVFIVDEVHMLTTEACNALLKTLEEPPAHVLFILATTDAQKLPATILSRCQRFEFRRGSVSLIGERLRFVAEAEGFTLEPEAARLVARASGGSWRDAISLLEQVLSYGGSEVTAATVTSVLGGVEEETLLTLADALARADGRTVYPIVERLVSAGTEPRQLARDLGEHFRSLLMADAGALPADVFSVESSRRLSEQAATFGTSRLVAALEALALADKEMRWSDSGRVVLEVALARLMVGAAPAPALGHDLAVETQQAVARPAPVRLMEPSGRALSRGDAEQPAAVVDEVPETRAQKAPPAPAAPSERVLPAANGQGPEEFDPFEHEELPPTVGSERASVPSAAGGENRRQPTVEPRQAVANDDGTPASLDQIRARWNVVVEELKRGRAVTTAALLPYAEPLRCEGAVLVIGFRQGILRDKWERGDNKQRLTAALKAVFGQAIATRSEVMSEETAGGGDPSPAVAPSSGTAPVGATTASMETPAGGRRREAGGPESTKRAPNGTDTLEGEALLHEVIAAFDGQIVEESPPLN